jgi:dolichol-phosphate mannosyltransferase
MNLNLSVVIPFFNEAECLEDVCMEAKSVLTDRLGDNWQLVMVDDGSSDATAEIIDRLAAAHPQFLALHLTPNSGQSAALQAGFAAASGELIATLDGDGQNDPADLPALLQEMERLQVDMMCGVRQRRADNWIRRLSSRIANRVRSRVLQDGITDVGCSIRVFRRSCLGRIRFFRNAHRFFPALFQIAGYTVAEMPVNHRQRLQGVSKYGGGIQSRLWVGLADLAGVYWLRKRALLYDVSSSASREGKAGDKRT